MGLKSWLAGLLGSSAPGRREDYRCLKCGAAYDVQHHECPDCGRRFVVPMDDSGDG